jgi:hypothetical protein|tara:strand:+ start:3109 stop:4158 length:1050 start_codon:yes stop_codon:yes gene_type:complete
MKISHEVPLCLLEDSKQFNNYDYALVHLLDSNEEYAEYFLKSKKEGRHIILDNSLHELGESYGDAGLLYWVNKLKPQEFIIPDVWCDRDASIRNAVKWASIKLPKGVEKVVVVQANTIHEASTCYKIYKELGYKKIAFSYGADYYNDVVPHPNKDIGKALGRLSVISALLETKVISQSDRIHLLGCASPFEFSLYRGIECIESIDTSNPIMMALEGKIYNSSLNVDKPTANMNNYFNVGKNDINLDLVLYNVNKFKEFLTIQKSNPKNNQMKKPQTKTPMMSLYDYTGKKDENGTGLKINTYAQLKKQPFEQRELDLPTYTGKVFLYTKEFLDEFFEIQKIFKDEILPF